MAVVRRNLYILCILSLLSACSPSRISEDTQQALACADSLRGRGVYAFDSIAMLTAINELQPMRFVFPNEYAKACYYYAATIIDTDPERAMRHYISATQVRATDHILLGRIYTNMGDICHKEGNYALSYQTFEKAAEQFLQAKDTTAYFYSLNDMAFELVKQKKKAKAYELLSMVESAACSEDVRTQLLLTKAVACRDEARFDSAICYVSMMQQRGYAPSSALLVKAQAFANLQLTDSALLYAQLVAKHTHSNRDLNNVYNVIASNSNAISKEQLLQLAQEKSVAQKELEVQQGKLSHAVALLQQNGRYKPLLRSLLWVSAGLTGFVAVAILLLYLFRRYIRILRITRSEQKRLSKMNEQNQQLRQEQAQYYSQLLAQLEQTCKVLHDDPAFRTTTHWNNYAELCNFANDNLMLMVNKLKSIANLNEKEMRLCILVLCDFSNRQIAELLSYAESGLGKLKYSTSKKLNVSTRSFRCYLVYMLIGQKANCD